jgi:hypothetical protein
MNQLAHAFVGAYVLDAMTTAVSNVMTPMLCDGKRSKQKYTEEPFDLFELTAEEKEMRRQQEQEKLKAQFKAWGDAMIKKYRKED